MEQARAGFSQISNLQIHIAEAQPIVSPSLLKFIHQMIDKIEQRIEK